MGTRSFILHGMFGKVLCLLLIAAANAAVVQEKDASDLRDSCGQCLMVKSTKSSVSAVFPWLFNKAKFYYSYLDGEDNRVYQANVGNKPYFLHFYDEGIFYNGFWVVNDSPDECGGRGTSVRVQHVKRKRSK